MPSFQPSFPTGQARRLLQTLAPALITCAFTPLLLTGCGGGGGINGTSSTSQGYRLVPAGGPVTPKFADDGTTNLTLNAQPNAVSQGVQVNVSHPGLSSDETTTLATQVGTQIGKAYLIQLTPQVSSFGSPIQLVISLSPADLQSVTSDTATIKIFTYDQAAKTWLALPGTFTPTTGAAAGGTVTGTMVFPTTPATFSSALQPALSDSGVYVVAYDVVPGGSVPNPPI